MHAIGYEGCMRWAAAAMLVVLASCGGDQKAAPTTSTTTVDQRAALHDNAAASGLNLWAAQVGLAITSGDRRSCSNPTAAAEIDRQAAALAESPDERTRLHATDTVHALRLAVTDCAANVPKQDVQVALDRYRERYDALRLRIEERMGPGP